MLSFFYHIQGNCTSFTEMVLMMSELTEENPGKQILLLGNEAITRGAFEAGIDVATTYPGTPSSEIADTFSAIAKEATKQNKDPGFYFQYSVNEKVALEVAAAASFCGLRALTCMKHVGLNVASDTFMTYMYVGCRGGHLIVSADDPYCHSSQNEQDNRYFALFGGAPMLEPTTPQEAKEMTRIGFDISEKLSLPLLLPLLFFAAIYLITFSIANLGNNALSSFLIAENSAGIGVLLICTLFESRIAPSVKHY